MRYGRAVEDGALPVFAVDTEDQARQLLTVACSTNTEGEFVAEELVQERTLESLGRFSKRLQETWAWMNSPKEGRPPLYDVVEHPRYTRQGEHA